MKRALLSALPAAPPGLTFAETLARLSPQLPRALFPGGAKAGWWTKAVQLDLEARGLLCRAASKPLRLYRGP